MSGERKLENNETPTAKNLKPMSETGNESKPVSYPHILRMFGETSGKTEETASVTGNESIPAPLPATPILHPRAGAAESKESIKTGEEERTNQNDYVVSEL